MSYILDALKKSDQERKRGDVPNLQTVHIPMNAEPQTPVLLYVFIFLLLIALAFVIGLVVSNHESGDIQIIDTNNHMQEKNEVRNKNMEASIQKNEKLAETAVMEKAVTASSKVLLQQSAEEVNQKAARINLKPASVEIEKANSEINKPVVNKANLNDIPYLHELPDYRQQSVPEMSFAGHIYSAASSSRSVIINGTAMSEGDVIVQGLNVVEITQTGVVFSLHNELFRMDILQDWSFE
ncbi:MAG: general secretion pathway protein GspB [Gammaproteobacteria bacterium]|nr:general secretion pathway protein GspB [Gammaproteobacteria bacterium]